MMFSGPACPGKATGPAPTPTHPSWGSWGDGALTASSHSSALGIVVLGSVVTGGWEPSNGDVRCLPQRRWWRLRAVLTAPDAAAWELSREWRGAPIPETGGREAGQPLVEGWWRLLQTVAGAVRA